MAITPGEKSPDPAAETPGQDSPGNGKRRDIRSRLSRARLVAEVLLHEIQKDGVFTQAAALTYKTLFSLLPVLVLALLILSKISGVDGKTLDKQFKEQMYVQLKIDKLTISGDISAPAPYTDENPPDESISPIPADPPANTGDTAPASDTSSAETAKPQKVTDIADKVIDNALAAVTNPATGLVAFAILLYGAISLMIVIETTFNQMYGAGPSRSWGRRIMLYWCVLTLGPIGVGASLSLGGNAASVAKEYSGNMLGPIFSAVSFISGYIVAWILFMLLYKLIPQTRVNWRHAASGAAVAAIAWKIGEFGFTLYMTNALKGSWYGSMAALPLFMFWIYLSWCIVLTGLELTYIQQYWRRMKRRYLFLKARKQGMGGFGESVMLSDIRWALAVAILVYRRFKEGKTTGVEEAAEALMLPNDVTGAILTAMEREKIVLCASEAQGHYTLARPADTITAYDLLTSMRTISEVPLELQQQRATKDTTSAALREFETLEAEWAKKRTLAELAA